MLRVLWRNLRKGYILYSLDRFFLDVVRTPLYIRSFTGHGIEGVVHTPRYMSRLGTAVPCVIMITSAGHEHVQEAVDVYTARGIMVVTYKRREVRDLFTDQEIDDTDVVYAYIVENLPWVDADRVFLMGMGYCGGIVLRSLSRSPTKFRGGIVLSPLTYIDSILDTVMSLWIHVWKMLVGGLRNDIPSGPCNILAQSELDRGNYILEQIDCPLYVHMNIQDECVDVRSIAKIFEAVLTRQSGSCIRYVHGAHHETEVDPSTREDIHSDVVKWCRSIVQDGNVQTYDTQVFSMTSQYTTALSPHDNDTLNDNGKIIPVPLSIPLVRVVDVIFGDAFQYLEPLSHLRSQSIWRRKVGFPITIVGFPVVRYTLENIEDHCTFYIHLFEYNCLGYGRRLCSQIVNASSGGITVTSLPMLAHRIDVGHEVVLSVSNLSHVDIRHHGEVPKITFTRFDIPLLYLLPLAMV